METNSAARCDRTSRLSTVDLARDRRVLDLRVVGQQQRLADDDRERAVALERQEQVALARLALESPARCRDTGRWAP